MSKKTKLLFKNFRSMNKDMYPGALGKLFDRCQTALHNNLTSSSIYKCFVQEYELFSDKLQLILNQEQVELFYELEEINEQVNFITSEMAYIEGFKDCFLLLEILHSNKSLTSEVCDANQGKKERGSP